MDPDRAAPATDAAARFHHYVVPELPVLLRVARRLTGQPDDAEDLVQETLVRAFRGIERFDGRYPRAWLLTILRNSWRNMSRKRILQLADATEYLNNVPSDGPDGRSGPEERVLDLVLDAELARGLADLPRVYREAVLLVDLDGLTYREAADVLGVPMGTVMSRLHRARRRLRRRLESAGLTPARRSR